MQTILEGTVPRIDAKILRSCATRQPCCAGCHQPLLGGGGQCVRGDAPIEEEGPAEEEEHQLLVGPQAEAFLAQMKPACTCNAVPSGSAIDLA